MAKTAAATSENLFKRKLAYFKKLIDTDIENYTKQIQKSTLQQYGANSRLEIDAFLDILGRGGKRIRGSLVIQGYEMSGGQDKKMILEAARAIEMLHAYILIIDDIQDRSVVRRGGPTAHIALADYHSHIQLAGKPEHFGVSIALNAALAGAHAAQIILVNLNVDADQCLKVLSIVNRTMLITAHGQTNDIINEVSAEVSDEDINRVMEWKTANYTFLSPLHIGMVLAGADCDATDAITDYAMHAGKAFQISDDILGTFGNKSESGKSPLDDVREGKRTILTVYGLQHASAGDRKFLTQMLGNQKLTQTEFQRCKAILIKSGSLKHAHQQAEHHIEAALKYLDKENSRWNTEGIQFLRGLAQYLLDRQS